MTTAGPPDQQQLSATEELPPPTSAVERANRMSAANMLRSLGLLLIICLAVVAWLAFVREEPEGPLRDVDPGPSIARAAEYAAYPLEAPADLPEGYTVSDTDVRGAPGSSVTLRLDYLTPAENYAGYVASDDPEADEVGDVLDGAEPAGTVQIAGREWTRSTTERGETALSRADGGVTMLVTGSAGDDELQEVAAAIRPATG